MTSITHTLHRLESTRQRITNIMDVLETHNIHTDALNNAVSDTEYALNRIERIDMMLYECEIENIIITAANVLEINDVINEAEEYVNKYSFMLSDLTT